MDPIALANKIKKAKEMIEKEEALKTYHGFSKKYIWITDKKGKKIKLQQNNAQCIVQSKIDELRAQGIPPRIIILKSRQMGITTDSQGRMIKDTTTKKNRYGLIVSHDTDSTKKIFRKTKYMFDNLAEDIKPLNKASNAKELLFDKPQHYNGDQEGLNSGITVQVAGSDGIGRSEAVHYAHLSEYAFWEGKDDKAPHMQLAGIMQAVPDELDTWVIIESTAKGFNDFKNEWDKAVRGETGFTPIFLAWYNHEEYTKPVKDKDLFISTMSEYEQWLYNDLGLPLERVAWWRHTFRVKCSGNLSVMKQENPTTPEEAFIFSGTPVFDNEKVMKRIQYLEENQMYREGYFKFEWNNPKTRDFIVDSSIKFVISKQKPWVRLFNKPRRGIPYVISGDTKGEGKDFFASSVMDNIKQERRATIHMQMNTSKPFTWQLYCLGRYFNNALIGVEMNFNTGPLEELDRLGYNNQYMREKKDDISGMVQRKYGWKTDGITRPLMIDYIIDLVDNYLYLIKDVRVLQEMLVFVYDKNGRPDAMAGEHDDLIIAESILGMIKNQQSCKVEVKEQKKQALPHELQDNQREEQTGGFVQW